MRKKHLSLPSEADLTILSRTSPVLMWVSDLNKQNYFFSEAWLEFTGRTFVEEQGLGWQQALHPEDLPKFISQYNEAFEEEADLRVKARVKDSTGVYRWLAHHGIPLYDPSQNLAGYSVTAIDIHDFIISKDRTYTIAIENAYEREQSLNEQLAATNEEMSATNEELIATNEELLRSQNELAQLNSNLESIVIDRTRSLEENQHRTREIIDTAPFPIGVYVGREMRIQFANKAITTVWGKGEDVIGKLYSEVLPELENQQVFSQLDSVFTTGVPFHAKNQRVDLVVGGKPTLFFFNYSFTPLRDSNGEIYGVMNTAADVTDLVEAKMAVDRSERNLYNMILQAPVAMCLLSGPDHVVTVANELMIEIWGKPASQMMNKPVFEGLPEAREQGLEEMLRDVYEKGITIKAHEQPVSLFRKGQTEVVYQNFVYEPYRDNTGEIVGVIAITADVSEQVHAKQLLEQSYKDQQSVSEELAASNEELASLNEELTVINEDLVEAQDELFRSEQLFKSIALNIPDSLILVVDRERRFMAVEGDLVSRLSFNSGDYIGKDPGEVSLPQEFLASHELYDRVLAGERLSVERKAATGEDFIIHLVPLLDENEQVYAGLLIALDITRIKSAEMQSAKLAAIVRTSNDAIVSKTLDGIITSWNESAERIFGYSESEMIGQSILRIIPEDRSQEEPAIISRIRRGERVEHFETVRVKKDGSLIDVSLSISPVRDVQGNIIGVSKIARDISEKKMEENRKNDFIGMVSHELKTPLTSLTALIQVLNLKLKNTNDGFVSGATEKAAIQVKKMATMINGFLNVTRLESGQLLIEKRPFEILELIREVVSEAELVAPETRIVLLESDPIPVIADPDKISSVVSNLVGNALKYSERGSTVTISARIDAGNVIVSVSDQGIGISSKDIGRLFERYYRVETTDTRHISGFGIGLYLSAEIVKRHGGDIWAESVPQQGSTFTFSIPLGSS